jgi:hypothetical protein
MILHVVLFRPREGLSGEERAAIVRSLQAAARRIPAVRRFRIGRRVKHGLPGYEQSMAENYEYALIAEFDGVAGLSEYLAHPAHAALGQQFTTAAASALAYDYEEVELSDLS